MEKALSALKKGELATVVSVCAEASMRRRFYDIGCMEGAEISFLGRSPMGDPCAYAILDSIIAIRKKDAASIYVRVEDR